MKQDFVKSHFNISYTADELRNNLILSALSNGNYLVIKPYCVQLNSGDLIHIDSGYQTNGADIPRLFWRLYQPYSPLYMPAVVLHDFLCDRAIYEFANKSDLQDKFLYADNAFREILERLGISKSKVNIFYNAVRLWHKGYKFRQPERGRK